MSEADKITSVDYALFGRVGAVELFENGSKIESIKLDGLDFEFETSQLFMSQAHSSPATATVKILGLTQASVDYLCQFCDEASFRNRNISVRVTAGYLTSNKGAQQIFNLPVVRAVPSAMPNNWVTISAKLYVGSEKLKSYLQVIPEDPGYVTAMQLLQDVASAADINWSFYGNAEANAEKIQVKSFSYGGGMLDAVNSLRLALPELRFIQLPDVDDNGKANYFIVYTKEEYDKGSLSQNTWVINSSTGMIGVPNWVGNDNNSRRITVRTLMNPAYRPCDTVKLKSVISKDLSRDDYRIWSVKHSGHLRGIEWYSDLELMSNG